MDLVLTQKSCASRNEMHHHAENEQSFHFVERLRQIGLKIGRIFQPNVQPHDAMTIVWPVWFRLKIVRHGQARDAGPAIADLKQIESIDERKYLLLREQPLEH